MYTQNATGQAEPPPLLLHAAQSYVAVAVAMINETSLVSTRSSFLPLLRVLFVLYFYMILPNSLRLNNQLVSITTAEKLTC